MRHKQAHPHDARQRGLLRRRRPDHLPGAALPRAESVQRRGRHTWPASTRPRPSRTRNGSGCSCGRRTRPSRLQTTTDSFDIVDTQGNQYYPVAINSQVNPYAWTPQALQPLGNAAGARQHRQLRTHAGRAAAVQAQHLGVLQPPADTPDLRAGTGESVLGLARPLTTTISGEGPSLAQRAVSARAGPSAPPDLASTRWRQRSPCSRRSRSRSSSSATPGRPG